MKGKTRYHKGLAALLALTLSFPIVPEIRTKAAEESETEYTTLEELETLESEDPTWEALEDLDPDDLIEEPMELETEPKTEEISPSIYTLMSVPSR